MPAVVHEVRRVFHEVFCNSLLAYDALRLGILQHTNRRVGINGSLSTTKVAGREAVFEEYYEVCYDSMSSTCDQLPRRIIRGH